MLCNSTILVRIRFFSFVITERDTLTYKLRASQVALKRAKPTPLLAIVRISSIIRIRYNRIDLTVILMRASVLFVRELFSARFGDERRENVAL